ncbi:T9SS type A sorting domain-containing protein [Chryseobacterium sp. C-71]|nr:T9SS type A sorting domain-containing protein [Chryseobacterium sp. C-71]
MGANSDKDYYYQIYNMSGQLVKTGKFENKQTNVSSLVSGAYLVRVNDSEAVVKIIKQ